MTKGLNVLNCSPSWYSKELNSYLTRFW